MIKCHRCGEYAEEPVWVQEYIRPHVYENWTGCPHCGSTDIEEVGECGECGQPCDKDDILCSDCKAFVHERLLNDINETFTVSEREYIWWTCDFFTREELNLKKGD